MGCLDSHTGKQRREYRGTRRIPRQQFRIVILVVLRIGIAQERYRIDLPLCVLHQPRHRLRFVVQQIVLQKLRRICKLTVDFDLVASQRTDRRKLRQQRSHERIPFRVGCSLEVLFLRNRSHHRQQFRVPDFLLLPLTNQFTDRDLPPSEWNHIRYRHGVDLHGFSLIDRVDFSDNLPAQYFEVRLPVEHFDTPPFGFELFTSPFGSDRQLVGGMMHHFSLKERSQFLRCGNSLERRIDFGVCAAVGVDHCKTAFGIAADPETAEQQFAFFDRTFLTEEVIFQIPLVYLQIKTERIDSILDGKVCQIVQNLPAFFRVGVDLYYLSCRSSCNFVCHIVVVFIGLIFRVIRSISPSFAHR